MKKAIVILIILCSISLVADVRGLRKKTDKMEGVTYYYSKSTPKHMFNLLRNNDLFFLYIKAYDNRKPKIYLCVHIEVMKWINLDEVIVMADEKRYIFRFDPEERHRKKHSETRRTEYFKVPVDPAWIPALKEISKATRVKLRYNGSDGYKNKKKLKKKHLDAIVQIFDAYEELGGSMEHLASDGVRYIQYAYLETIARTPSIAESKTFPEMNRFDDENISIVWAPQSEGLSFKIKNNFQSMLSIIWDESTFVDQRNVSHKVMHKGVKYIDRNKSMPPSVVPPGTTSSDLLFPSDYARYIDGEGWKNKEILKVNIVGDALKPLYNGMIIKAYLVLKVGEKKFTYEFGFKTDVIEESKISTISEMKKFPVSKVTGPAPATTEVEIKKGMTIAEVEKLLGKPLKATKFGKKTLYKYGDYKITFVDGKVAEVDF